MYRTANMFERPRFSEIPYHNNQFFYNIYFVTCTLFIRGKKTQANSLTQLLFYAKNKKTSIVPRGTIEVSELYPTFYLPK